MTRTSATKLERALALISAPDDPAKDGEQTPGTRRRGRAPLQERRVGEPEHSSATCTTWRYYGDRPMVGRLA